MVRNEIWPPFKFAIWVLPATILFIVPGFVDPINLPKLLVLCSCTIVSWTLFALLRRYREASPLSSITKSSLALYVALIVTMTVSGLSGSENFIRILFGAPGRNNGLFYYVSVISLSILVLRTSIRRIEVDFVQKVLAISSLILGLYCMLQYFNLDPVQWVSGFNRIIGTLGNPNFSSAVLATFSIFWLYLSLRTEGKKIQVRLLTLSTSLILAFLSWATASLQGLIILGVGGALVAYVYLRERYLSRFIPLFALVGGGLGLSILFISFLGLGPLGSQLEQYTLKLRATYAAIGVKAMLESPLHGVGVDNYLNAFRLYRTNEFINQYGLELNADNAHSTPAQIGATFGIVIFILYVALHLLVFIRAARILNSRDISLSYAKGIAVVWTLVFAQSLLSIELIGLGVMNWILGALLLGIQFPPKGATDSPHYQKAKKFARRNLPAWVGSATIVVTSVSLIPWYVVAQEESAFKNVIALEFQRPEDGDWIRKQFSDLTPLTLLEPSKASRLFENMEKAGMIEEIDKVILDLYANNPQDVYANDLIATRYRNSGDVAAELQIREKLRNLDPMNYQLEVALARIYAAKGDLANLQVSVTRINSIAPDSKEAREANQLLKDTSATP